MSIRIRPVEMRDDNSFFVLTRGSQTWPQTLTADHRLPGMGVNQPGLILDVSLRTGRGRFIEAPALVAT